MSPGATSCASQIFSNIVFGMTSAPSQSGSDDGEKPRLAAVGILEVVRKVGVEGDAVPFVEIERLAVADEPQLAGSDNRRLARTRLVHRRVIGPAGRRPRLEHVQRNLGTLAGQPRRDDLVAVAARAAASHAALG